MTHDTHPTKSSSRMTEWPAAIPTGGRSAWLVLAFWLVLVPGSLALPTA